MAETERPNITNGKFVIYKITSKANDKKYVGSTENFERRKRQHISTLKSNEHRNHRLQSEWDRFGEDNFIFEIIDTTDTYDKALEIEQYWMDKYDSFKRENGFNISPTAGNTTGRRLRKSTRMKLSESHTGKTLSESHKEAISESMKGYVKTREHQEKITRSIRERSPEIYVRGGRHHNAKLTEDQVKEIIIKVHAGECMDELASKYGVGRGAIESIKYNRSWKHIDRNEILKIN